MEGTSGAPPVPYKILAYNLTTAVAALSSSSACCRVDAGMFLGLRALEGAGISSGSSEPEDIQIPAEEEGLPPVPPPQLPTPILTRPQAAECNRRLSITPSSLN